MRSIRVSLGLLFTALALWWGCDRFASLAAGPDEHGPNVAGDLWMYVTGRRETIQLRFSRPTRLAVGDPIFVADATERLRQVGEVAELVKDDHVLPARWGDVDTVRALIYPSAPPITDDAEIGYYSGEQSLAWVVDTLLTPDRKAEMTAELRATLEKHQAEIVSEFKPIIEDSLRDALRAIESELPAAIERHRPAIQSLAQKYRRELVDAELLPLITEEVWPIVRTHAEPKATEIGREMWERVSLWRFGWRMVVDKAPLTQKNLIEKEWTRFVEEDATPILESHAGEFVDLVNDVLRDMVENERIEETVRKAIARMADDPEVRELIARMADDLVLHNDQLHQVMQEHWQGPRAERAIRIASDRLEPTVRRLADLVLGTQTEGITPEFALVLRRQILQKDSRWLLLEPGAPTDDASNVATPRELHAVIRGTAPSGGALPQVPGGRR